MRQRLGALLVGLIALAVIAGLALFVVDQRQNAIVFRLGEIVDIKSQPGLYFKIPVLDNVRYFDTRILTFDTAEPERFITSEKKNVLVDLFVKWRIVDVRQYYISVGGDEARAIDARSTDDAQWFQQGIGHLPAVAPWHAAQALEHHVRLGVLVGEGTAQRRHVALTNA